jgi:hypothetical protein
MNFWTWFWHLLASLPWGLIGMVIFAVLLAVIGLMELTWRLFRGVGPLAYVQQEMRDNGERFVMDWRLWVALVTTIGIFGLSLFAFYVVQIEGTAVLPAGWQDGRWFLLCATVGSWTFGLAVFRLLKGEIDWRLTTVLFMLGWLCMAWAGSWLRIPEPKAATPDYVKTVQRLKLLPGSGDGPKWIGWGLLAGGLFLTLVVPAVGARLWWRPNGGRMRTEARKVRLEANILRFKRSREASAAIGGSQFLKRAAEAGNSASSMWHGAKWGTLWWLLCWLNSRWDMRAAVVAGLFASAFTWQMLGAFVAIVELMRAPETQVNPLNDATHMGKADG